MRPTLQPGIQFEWHTTVPARVLIDPQRFNDKLAKKIAGANQTA